MATLVESSPSVMGNAQPPLADPRLETLAAMFPEIEKEVLALMLSHHRGNIEAAVSSILDVSAVPSETVQEQDAMMARALQQEQDEQVARAINESLQQELKDEAARQLPARAERAISQVATKGTASVKSLLQRLSAGKAGSSRATSTSTHAVRLLQTTDEPHGGYDTTPLSMPLTSPLSSEYAPPLVATPAASPAPITSSNSPMDAGARYSSRMERARSANSARQLSGRPSTSASSTASLTEPHGHGHGVTPLPTAPAEVPVGELI